MQESQLFSPFELRGVTLKNRIVISPMQQYQGEHGRTTDYHLMHYGQLAEGGAALVLQEGTTVDKRGRGTIADIGIWDDDFIPALTRITDLVKKSGAVPGVQLMHAGRKVKEHVPWDMSDASSRGVPLTDEEMSGHDPDEWDRMAPSAVAQALAPHHPVAREMSRKDIDEAVNAHVVAAIRADRAGYEVLEIHAAHGYLINTFLSEMSNHRTDEYGGSFDNRARFLLDIVEGIRSVWPDGKPILVRLSCIDGTKNWTLNHTVRLARMLKAAGVDMIDCSMGGIANSIGADRRTAYGYQVGLAETIRREVGIPTNAVGMIVHAHHAEAIIASGKADTIAIGRESIWNPNWPMDAAYKLGADPEFARLPDRQRVWMKYRAQGMPGFLPSTHSTSELPSL